MDDGIKYAVFDQRETLAESIFKDLVTFSFLIFSIWFSQGSKWWTLVTALMLTVFVFGKISVVLKRYKRFKTKAELQKWVNGLEEV